MVLTEDKLKNLYRKKEFKKYIVENGTIMTPSARQFLADKGIELVTNSIGGTFAAIKPVGTRVDTSSGFVVITR